ncbi:MAG TPA: DHA2 family efflux MFS transporter permease subunit, partial [Chroococcales cyanobacterium]
FINIPFGIAAVIMCMICLPNDTERKVSRVDWIGITLMTVSLASLQYVLEKGQEDDWFSSPLILTLSITAVVALVLFLVQELTTSDPAVDLKVLRHKSVAAGTVYSLILGCGLFGLSFVVPNFAQTVMAYTAMQAGMLQLPGSIASGVMMPIMGAMSGKFDSRILVGIGAVSTALVMFALGNLSPQTGYDDFFWPLIFRGIATVFMYMPLTMATLGSCPPQDIAAASAFFSLSRQLGGSIGIAALTTMLDRRQDFHRAVLVENINNFNPAVQQRLQQFQSMFHSLGNSPQDALKHAYAVVDATVNSQSLILSFADLYWMLGVMFLVTLPLLFFLDKGKRSKLAAGAH